MRRIALILACLTLAGCSSFSLGTMVYIPHGQAGTVSVTPTAAAASAAK